MHIFLHHALVLTLEASSHQHQLFPKAQLALLEEAMIRIGKYTYYKR
jgi:hypothetical protein